MFIGCLRGSIAVGLAIQGFLLCRTLLPATLRAAVALDEIRGGQYNQGCTSAVDYENCQQSTCADAPCNGNSGSIAYTGALCPDGTFAPGGTYTFWSCPGNIPAFTSQGQQYADDCDTTFFLDTKTEVGCVNNAPQGRRTLSPLSRDDFDKEIVVPSAASPFHGDAILGRMLFQNG